MITLSYPQNHDVSKIKESLQSLGPGTGVLGIRRHWKSPKARVDARDESIAL